MKTSNGRIIAVIDETIEMFHNDKWTQDIFARDEAGNSMNVEDPQGGRILLGRRIAESLEKGDGSREPLVGRRDHCCNRNRRSAALTRFISL